MSNYLKDLSRPAIYLAYFLLGLFVFLVLSMMNVLGGFYNSFKQTLWQSYNVPAPIAFILFIFLVIILTYSLDIGIKMIGNFMYRIPLWWEMLMRRISRKFGVPDIIEGEIIN